MMTRLREVFPPTSQVSIREYRGFAKYDVNFAKSRFSQDSILFAIEETLVSMRFILQPTIQIITFKDLSIFICHLFLYKSSES